MSEVAEATLTLEQTAELQVRKGNSVEMTIRPALRAAGLASATSLFYQDDGGTLVAVGTDYAADGRSDDMGRQITQRKRVVIPPAALDVLGLDADAVAAENPKVAVYAGDGVLAIRPVDELSVAVDRREVPE